MPCPASQLVHGPLLASLLEREQRDASSLSPGADSVPPLLARALFEPLAEISQRPSKQLRARMVEVSFHLAGGSGELPQELLAMVEALHLGSLIVDDIEDGSLERRGAPALHGQIGVPLALNAGNWLYFWPGELLSRVGFAPERELELRRAMDRATLHCHYGQALDLSVRINELRQREVLDVVFNVTRLKTGSLMQLAAEIGAITAGADREIAQALTLLGRDVGIVLQMLDDLTSVTRAQRLAKGREDLLGARPSWVWAWLAQGPELNYQRIRAQASELRPGAPELDAFVEHVGAQVCSRGRSVIRDALTRCLVRTRAALGDATPLNELESELQRLERYDA